MFNRLVFGGLFLVAAASVSALEYRVQEIAPFQGDLRASASRVSGNGTVAVVSQPSQFESRPGIWSKSGGLNSVPGFPSGIAATSYTGISNNGLISGWYQNAGVTRGFVYRVGLGFQNIEPLPGEMSSSTIYGNDSGQVLGSSGSRGFLWSESTGAVDLGSLPNQTVRPLHLNQAGEALVWLGDGGSDAFVWNASTGFRPVFSDSGMNATHVALRRNNSGEVGGRFGSRAFIWSETGGNPCSWPDQRFVV